MANPTGAQVAAGSATFNSAGKTLTVTNTPGTILNWQSFSIGAGELTRFQQQSALSAVLNRVTAANPSSILGTLSSNGRVFLVNPHGIVFGAGSTINTAGFVASTLNISDADFLAGRLKFDGGGNGVLRNEGAIRASGDIFLVGPQIENAGLIKSDNGSVVLAAGQSVTITSPDAQGVQFALQAPADAVLNLGAIEAGNAASLFAGTLKHSGDIRATSASVDASGRVILAAQKDAIVDGNATINVDNSAGRGGSVQITGERVGLFDNAAVSARGAAGGGEILVGGDYQGANPEVRNAALTHVAPGALLDASATATGDGGRIIVWADDSTRVHGSVYALGGPQGGAGGLIETSGKRFLDVSGIRLSASGETAGTWLLDPYNIEIVAGGGTANNGGGPAFTPSGDDSQIGADLIVSQLDGGTSVSISTGLGGSPGTQDGNITVSSPIVKAAVNNASLTLTAQNDIAVNANITLPGDNSNAIFSAGNNFSINSATVQAANVSVTAGGSIARSGAQTNDILFGRTFPSPASLSLTSNGGAVGVSGDPLRFGYRAIASVSGDFTVNTAAAGAGGHVYLRPTMSQLNLGSASVQTAAASVQSVVIDHTGSGANVRLWSNAASNDDWNIQSAGGYTHGGNTLSANSMNVSLAGSFGTGGVFPLVAHFDTSAANGSITLSADNFDGTGAGGSQIGVGVKPGTGIVTATSTGTGVGGQGTGGSIQLVHFGGDLLTSRYNLNFTGGTAGAFMRLKAADGHLIVDSTAGFNASLNNKDTLLQTLAAGRDVIFQGGAVQGGRVEVRATRNIDNLAPGTSGFVQTNIPFVSGYWKLYATGGGIGPTNPVEGTGATVGDLVSGGVGALGDINVKFNAGAGTPGIATISTQPGSAQNINITTAASLGFAPGAPGYGGSFSTANDHYTMNVGGSMFFTMFNDTATAASFDLTVAGSAVTNACCGTTGRWISTTGALSITSTGGSIGESVRYANLPASGGMTLTALDSIYIDAGANPLTLAGLSTGPGVGTIGLRTTSTNDLIFSGTTNINDALVLNIGGNIIFPAAADFTTSGGLGLNSPTQIAATASVNVTGGTFTATQPVTNAGTLSIGIGGATTLAAAFHNTGTLDVNAGTVNLAGGGSSIGIFDAAPGAIINFSAGTHNLGDGSMFTGDGTIGYTGGTLNLNGSGAGTTIAAGTTLAATGQTFGGTGDLVNFGTFNLANSTVSGDLDNQGLLNASGTSAVNGALDLTTGTLNLVAGGTLTKGGGATDWIGGAITGSGSYTGGLTFTGGGARVLNGPTLNIPNLLLPAGSLEMQGGVLNLSGASQIAAGASLLLTGGSLSASGTLLNNGSLTKATGGVTSLAALLTNNGNLNINAGTFSVAGGIAQTGGNVALASGTTLRFPTGTSSTWTGGTLTQAALDSLVVLDNATLNLNSDITNTGTWQTQFTANLAGTGTLTNTGKLNLFANFLSATPAVISANLVNQGVIETRDVIQINGAFSNAPGATLLNNDAAVTVANGFTNAGTIQLFSDLVEQPPSFTVTSGTLTNTGSIVTTGSVIQDQPLVAQIDNQGTIAANIGRLVINKAGATHVNSGAINANTANVLVQQSGGGTFTHAGGTITTNPGRSFTVAGGPMHWQGGALAGTGTHTHSGGLTFSGSGARVLNGPSLTLGTATIPGGSLTVQNGALNFGGIATIANGATLDVAGGSVNGALSIDVQGLLKMSGGNLTATSVGLTPGGVLSGTGTVNAAVVNGGTVAVGASPGTLIINGNYEQSPLGILDIELGGTNQGVDYDLLQVTGTANLGGTLNVSLFGGFTGTDGDLFDFMTFASRTGDFANINFPIGSSMTAMPNAGFYQLLLNVPPPPPPPPVVETTPPDEMPLQLAANDVRILQDKFFSDVQSAKEREDEDRKGAVLECR